MKIAICLSLALLAHLSILAQQEAEEIKKTFESYRLLIEQKEYDNAFDFYHKDFLNYLPKDDLKKQFAAIDDPGRLEYSVSDSKLIFVSTIVKAEVTKYAVLKYRSYYHFRFNENVADSEIERIKSRFKNDYGEDYSYHKRSKTITIYKEQELIAIGSPEWRFIPYKEKLKPYMNLWIPENIFSELLTKRQAGK